MAILFDNDLLRRSTPPELVAHFNSLLKENPNSEKKITSHLLTLTEREAISPTVFTIWISTSNSPGALLEAISQDFSIYIRSHAINRLAIALRTKQWKTFWDGVGGAPALLSMLARFSVTHVKTFLDRVARCKRYKHPDIEQRGRHFSELLQGLLPSLFPDARSKSVDERRFIDESGHSLFARLLFACDLNFVNSVIHDATKSSLYNPKVIGNIQSPPQFKQLPREWREGMTRGQRKLIQPLEPVILSIPLVKSSISGITDPMTFSLNLIEGLAAQKDIKIDEVLSFFTTVITPLIRTACRRRDHIGPQNLELVFACCCKFLDSRPGYIRQLKFESHNFLHYLIRAWDFAAEERPFFNDCLKSILQRMPYRPGCGIENRWLNFKCILTWVQPSNRLRILRLVLKYHGSEPIDVDLDEDLRLLGKAQAHILRAIPLDEALYFLHKIRGSESKPTREDLANFLGETKDLDAKDPKNLEKYKRLAITESDKDQRTSFAETAVQCAIATGSTEIYGDMLGWAAKRYMKDYLTAKRIFSSYTLKSSDSIALLSAIPESPDEMHKLGRAAITAKIKDANRVILQIVETACLALKEPSFSAPDWTASVSLISDIVRSRCLQAGQLQQELKFSSDDVYDVVWKDTLALVTQLERMSLQPGFEKLLRAGSRGPLNLPNVKDFGAKEAFLRFVDGFAQIRDAITKEFRLASTPEVWSLHPSLPRGSTLKLMLGGFMIEEAGEAPRIPFIHSRAESTVFPDPNILDPIPEPDLSKSYIEPYVENYNLALRIYIQLGATPEARNARKIRAWSYAIENLSDRMTQAERDRFWQVEFRSVETEIEGPFTEQKDVKYPRPLLSLDTEYSETTETAEWDPLNNFVPPAPLLARSLNSTYLDWTLNNGGRMGPKVYTYHFYPPHFNVWECENLSVDEKRDPSVKEGAIASALLYIDSKIKGPQSILKTPFPNIDKPRYPSIYLANKFLQRTEIDVEQALRTLRRQNAHIVPPKLLVKLAMAAFEALTKEPSTSTKLASMENLAFRLLVIIT